MGEACILGIGVDLVENSRMTQMLRRWGAKFRDKVFVKTEQQYCDSKAFPNRHYAGRFAVKEAVTKAFGTGVGTSLSWLDIEVVRDRATGAPSVRFSDKARKLMRKRRAGGVLISLSHTRNYAVAHAILLSAHRRGSCS